jgi:hypothetical protein
VVSVPATLQAAIAARIDRLGDLAKQTLNAAAVIGMRFGPDLSAVLDGDIALTELVQAELIDQVRFTPSAEYAFHNPLIRTVAYESQLRADRAVLHRRLAEAIVRRDSGSADEDAALTRAPRSGGRSAAARWHMRAGVADQPRPRGGLRELVSGATCRRQLPRITGRMAMRIAPARC